MYNDPNAMAGYGAMSMGGGMGLPPMNQLGGGYGAMAGGGAMMGGMGGGSMYGADQTMGMAGMDGGAGGYGAVSGMGGEMSGGGYRGRGGFSGPPRGRGRGRGGDYGATGGYGGGYGGGMGGYGGSGYGSGSYGGMPANPMDPTDPRNRCNFFNKMGACRHADACTKFHIRPTNGQTVLFPKMYTNPLALEYLTDREWNFQFDPKFLKKYFHDFYKNIWRTLMKLGRILELRVVSNLCDHLVGNVYVKFADPAKAAFVCESLRHRKYKDILLLPEMTPVSDFDDACCKEDRDAGNCERKYQCNFLHLLKVSREVMDKLVKEQDEYWEGREKLEQAEAEKERERAERKAKEAKEREAKENERKQQKEKEREERREKEKKDKGASSSHRDRERERDDKDKRDKHHSSSRDKERKDERRDRPSRRDSSRDRDRRRDRSRDRSRGRDYSKDRSYRDKRDGRGGKRDRSPAGAADDRLCMVCGRKGHISKDCSLKI